MQKIFLVALASLFIFASCKNEPQTKSEQSETVAVPVKSGNAKDLNSTPTDITDESIATLTEEIPSEEKQMPTELAEAEKSPSVKKEEKPAPKPKKEMVKAKEKTPGKEAAPAEKTQPEKPKVEIATPQTIEKEEVKKEEAKIEKAPAKPQPPSHSAFDELLRKYVSSAGKVNYAGLKSEVAKLDGYLKILENNAPKSDWPQKEKLAFWINAYNAFTLKLIVENYPVSSITNLDGGKPWDKKWIKIGGNTYSLNNIENDIIRPRFKEPRIHFAVNCAAKSCPPLLNRAWTASNLESNFEKRVKSFINNSSFNQIGANKVKVSKIFDWYGADFGNLISYLNKYSSTKINADAKIEFLEYDWALNK